MDGLLRVTPEKLLSTSEEFGMLGSQMSSLTDEMLSLVSSLKGVWSGEAAMTYGGKFQSLQGDMDKLYRMVCEHSKDLSEMARSYQEAENMNNELGASMNANIVS
ncbi:MAG: WXG100 family type VII secretion target [Lachnospiraceae bacterium]|nr:WXG100 family type VII secretion target [Lachnospiraceae bacterium]